MALYHASDAVDDLFAWNIEKCQCKSSMKRSSRFNIQTASNSVKFVMILYHIIRSMVQDLVRHNMPTYVRPYMRKETKAIMAIDKKADRIVLRVWGSHY
jgi:hypothetical protein